jgi:mono/diheme cytochrome c family protein
MLSGRLPSGALGAVFFMLGAAAQAADLPPGPNRELVARECQACHNLDAVVASNETREIWNTLLESMTSYGLRVSPEDRAKILDYLATALGPEPGTAR